MNIDNDEYDYEIDAMTQLLCRAFDEFIIEMNNDNNKNKSVSHMFGVVINSHIRSITNSLNFIILSIVDEDERNCIRNLLSDFLNDFHLFINSGKYFYSVDELSH